MHRVLPLVFMLSALGACTPAMREYRQRPTPLARDWLDPKKSTPTDTSVWRLSPDGADRTLHVLLRTDAIGPKRQEKLSQHGIWYLRGAITDTLARSLCFKRRPSRSAPTCTSFRLDTLSDGRLRMVLSEYVGTHETVSRTLIERRP
ncbi:MAG: hypothetical protein M3Y64_03420 [Gemmatimonadota bacterium]|nr:hypothetical protein [Gemmatimonadota bacterium]